MAEFIRLTQYSHGTGCGCKISPKVLDVVLAGSGEQTRVARREYVVEVA